MDSVPLTPLEKEVIKRICNKNFHEINLLNKDLQINLKQHIYTFNEVLQTLYTLEERGIIRRESSSSYRKTYSLISS
ncbi:DUF3116 family protein [Listeria kieliensis]|uniref:Uncharacterized protein n=1 Tax=Listeria kieliensis TaxID=1621700 RepID=A0A3D8TSD1_9LIST|nr:hypothetical protein UR08_10610 [Listeria kieliensis]